MSHFFLPFYQVVAEWLYENHGREEVVHLDARACLPSSLPSPFLIAHLRHIIIRFRFNTVVGDHYHRLNGWRSAYRGLASDIVDDTILNQLLARLAD